MMIALTGDVYIPFISDTKLQGKFKDDFYAPFDGCDLVFSNYEAPVAFETMEPREKKSYNLRHLPESLDLFDQRFVLSLANNHIMDFGDNGLRLTLKSLRERGIPFAGAGLNLEEASRPVYLDRGGSRLAFVAAADPRFQPAKSDSPGTMPATPDLLDEVLRAANKNADRVFVSIHAGMEFTRVPTPFMLRLAKVCAESGAAVVAFHHAHCISGHTQLGSTDIFWGLGNYCFPRVVPVDFKPWFDSAIVRVHWEADSSDRKIDVRPIRLNSSGHPSEATGKHTRRIGLVWSRCSTRITSGQGLRFWRMGSLLRPTYIQMSWVNYLAMIRHMGIQAFLRFLFTTARLYINGGRK